MIDAMWLMMKDLRLRHVRVVIHAVVSVVLMQLVFIDQYRSRCGAADTPYSTDTESVTERCRAAFQSSAILLTSSITSTGDDGYGSSVKYCNDTCLFQQYATVGCGMWSDAVWNDCNEVCNETLQGVSFVEVEGCVRGCQAAVDLYTSILLESLNRWSWSGLVAGSKSNHSLTLQWAVPRGADVIGAPSPEGAAGNITYRIQKQIVGLSPEWIYHSVVRWFPRQRVRVSGLLPYVTYKFRLVIAISSSVSYTSSESVPIAMEPYGAPLQPPEIVATSSSTTSIHLKWKSPFFIGAPLIGYRLTVSSPAAAASGHVTTPGAITRVKEIIIQPSSTVTASSTAPDDVLSDVVTMLRPDTEYIFTLAALNQYGVGPAVVQTVRTQLFSSNGGQAGYLIVTVDNKIVKQDLGNLFSEPELVYEDPDESLLVTGAAIHFQRGLIYFSTSRDQIHRVQLPSEGVTNSSASAYRPITSSGSTVVYSITTSGGAAISGSGLGGGLAVDWLNNRLYFTEDNKVKQCDLDLATCSVAFDHLEPPPEMVNVDPCNGYLYWTQRNSGICRGDLPPSLGASAGGTTALTRSTWNATGQRIITRQKNPGPFIVDCVDYRIYYVTDDGDDDDDGVVVTSSATLMSADLDGTGPMPVRESGATGDTHGSSSSDWTSLTGLARHRSTGSFYWSTAAGRLWAEEKDPSSAGDAGTSTGGGGVYHQNEMLVDGKHFTSVSVWHSTSQPVPVPLSAPTHLQVLFSVDSALASWKEPDFELGWGVWRRWSYEMQLVDNSSGAVISPESVSVTNLTVNNLIAGILYRVRVRACSTSGCGPWSEEFIAQTLKTDSAVSPYIFYSDSKSIFKTTMDRSSVSAVTDVTLANGIVRELSLFAHVLIMVTENGSVYSTFEGQPLTPLAPVLNSVGLVVFDWLTDTLYWTCKHLNLIQRMTYSKVLAGSSSADLKETVHQSSSLILDLELDSVHGYMYWTTASSVEMAHLDGQSHRVLLRLPNFSGRYVLGLTIDVRSDDGGGHLYWLMKDSGDQLSLHATDLAASDGYWGDTSSAPNRILCSFPGRALIPTIEFYSNKLMWLGGQNVISVLDVTGCSTSHMTLMTSAESSDVSAFTLFHSAKFLYPDNFNKSVTVVIPDVVDIANTSVVGTAENYTVLWTPTTTQHGTVYYRLQLQWGASQRLEMSREPQLSIIGFTKPYSWLHLTIRACTYWGCSASSHKTFRSPMGAPSAPQRLRAFVTYQRNRRSKRRQQIRVDIRWSRPSDPGGIITSYHVFVTSDLMREAWNQTSLAGEQLANKFSILDVQKNVVLYFKIKACTEVACSVFSDTALANTSVEKPLPRLVTLVNDSIRVLLPADEDSRSLTVIQAPVVALCYIAYDESFYWIDKSGNLMSSSSSSTTSNTGAGSGGGLDVGGTATSVGGGGGGTTNKTSKTESLGRLKGRGKSIVADWVDRNLYYLEEQNNDIQNAIMKYDLNRKPESSDIVLVRPALILGFIQVSPKQRSLYWTETPADGKGRLMKCNVDGSNVELVMLQQRQSQQPKPDTVSRSRFRPLRSSPPSDDDNLSSAVDSSSSSLCATCPTMSISPVFVLDHTATVDTMTSTPTTPTMFLDATIIPSTSAADQQVVNIYVVDADSGDIWSLDSNGCHCRLIINASDITSRIPNAGLPPVSLTVDQDRLYWTSGAQHWMLSVDKRTGLDLATDHTPSPVKNILAFGENLQPLPDGQCLKVMSYGRRPSLIASTNSSLTLQLLPWRPAVDCTGDTWRLPVPVKYTVFYYKEADSQNPDGNITLCDRQSEMCSSKDTYDQAVMLTSLDPYTSYAVQVQATTYYTETPPPLVESDTVYFRTKPGIPSRVQDINATTHTPNAVTVRWRAPADPRGRLEDVIYVIEWNTNNTDGSRSEGRSRVTRKVIRSESSSTSTMDKTGLLSTLVSGLKHSHLYVVRVLAYDAEMTGFSGSQPVFVRTYQNPYVVELQLATATVLQISWMSSIDDSIVSHVIEFTEVRESLQWSPLGPQVNTTNATLYYRALEGLRPSTGYAIRVSIVYRSGYRSVWPTTLQATFFTLADVPARPELVWISDTTDGNLMVRWKAPYDSGSSIQHYQLDCRWHDNENWTTVYNGTETEWLITSSNILNEKSYQFRVAARNAIGWGPYSNGSQPFALLPRTVRRPDNASIELVLPLSILLLLMIVVFGIVFITCRRRVDGKQGVNSVSTVAVGGITRNNTDHELATLRELPIATVQTSNALYTINNSVPTAEEVASLRHFHRDQIKLTMFLGSGAFGEVFEGVAIDVSGDNRQCTKVAVKTLHKNASEFEKEEFLKEALLMSNFKHEHILQMLGVCLNNDPQFIILELMEGGDLLSFLRSSRPIAVTNQSLALPDMISICFDICKGCEYLEDLHFVHRDLAARNCLISTSDGSYVVKIGDFGLARDIYKNDYYRKEGECLLPVRWMSPESLIDGVFTTQSDVWAYGVLIWEVLTLGQQPYPARTNTEVLHFVRSGGRLDRPDNCPDDLYHLMLKCWLYVPHTRPSFKYLTQQICGFMQRAGDPLDDFSGRRDHLRGQIFRPRMNLLRHAAEYPTTSDDSSNDSATRRERHLTISSRKSMPTGIGRRSRAVTVSRRRPMSDPNSSAVRAAMIGACRTEAGYLQPLIVSAAGTDSRTKYLELLDMPPTLASRHQLIGSLAAARMARPGGASPALPSRSQYSALLSDDSPGTSFGTGIERCWKDDGSGSGSTDETRNSPPSAHTSTLNRVVRERSAGGGSSTSGERLPTGSLNGNRINSVGRRLSSNGSSEASTRHQEDAGNGGGVAAAVGASLADISPLLPRCGQSQNVRDRMNT